MAKRLNLELFFVVVRDDKRKIFAIYDGCYDSTITEKVINLDNDAIHCESLEKTFLKEAIGDLLLKGYRLYKDFNFNK